MSDELFSQLLYLGCGGLLLSSVLMLWRRQLSALITLLTAQGVLLAGLATLLGTQDGGVELYAVAAGILLLKAGVLPTVLRRVLADTRAARETQPLVNVPASLLAAAILTLVAYGVSQPLVELDPTPATHAAPVGIAMVLLGFFVLVTRRRALSQVAGFLLLDNGIAATAFLVTAGRTSDRGARRLHGPAAGRADPAGPHRAPPRRLRRRRHRRAAGTEGPMNRAAEILLVDGAAGGAAARLRRGAADP